MHIPFQDLTRQYKNLKSHIDDAVLNVMKGGRFILGKHVQDFEQLYASYIGTRHAIAVGSGTDALTLGLRAMGIHNEDEVIVPANSYPTAFGVALSGASIRLVDCKEDGTLNPDRLTDTITKRIKAIIAVHLYGNPADVSTMLRFTQRVKQKIIIIEDCAQAHGAESRVKSQESRVKSKTSSQKNDKKLWKKVGSIGDIGCFSFYPTKNLGAYGDGGMITTSDQGIALRCRALRMYGETKRYRSIEISGVSRLDELQAAILTVKLRFLDIWNQRRETIARHYHKELSGVGDLHSVTRGIKNHSFKPVHHLFVVRTRQRNNLQAFLSKKGIGTGIHYPTPIHLTKAFVPLGYRKGDFPVAEAMSREILSLPIFPELTDNEVMYIVRTIKRFYESKTRRRL